MLDEAVVGNTSDPASEGDLTEGAQGTVRKAKFHRALRKQSPFRASDYGAP